MIPTPCRLYLLSPPQVDGEPFARQLDSVLAAIDVAAFELRLDGAHTDDWGRAIAALLPVTQRRDVAFLLGDRPELAAETGCDGVYLSFLEGYQEARRGLGEGAIIGVAAQGSRHQAMEAGESGAAFVGIGPAADGGPELDLLAWWSELMEVPSVAFGVRTPQESADVVKAGADFLCPDPEIWDAADGPAAALTRLLAAVPDPEDPEW